MTWRRRSITGSGRKDLDLVGAESGVSGDHRQTFDLRLGDQHAVERVAVMTRQIGGCERVPRGHGKLHEVVARDLLHQVGAVEIQSTECRLERKLPDRRSTNEDGRGRIGNRLPGSGTELGIFGEPPEKGVAIQEELHSLSPRNAARTSSGSGSSKSGPRRIRPFRRPGRRGSAATGTSFATGRPLFAMMTSSPRATRSSSFDRWVLASCTLKTPIAASLS